ncbi:ATP-binding protein [Streptomyces harbinensis]|uniref:AAA ATPase domain-containing protein n=1 Tax=Streptomyces harbinensis TaxID=1176198 RepID=A0A1I6RYP1_9ACTN|nr:AAA family ATPase [Streptomyces harbinensis]SFS69710.1 AAA ATPase domain-containing protein [Streptomyces harbinensis]
MRTAFVDRVDSMGALLEVARDLTAGRGQALVVEGVSGMGKSALLDAFAQRIENDPELRRGVRLVTVRCAPDVGDAGTSPYAPMAEILLELNGRAGARRRWQRAAGVFGRSIPRLLAQFVPGAGPLLDSGQDIVEAALRTGSMPGDSLLPQQESMALRTAEALLAEAAAGRPALVLLDDIQYLDLSSLQVLDRLVRALPDAPLALVLGHRVDGLDSEGAIAELLQRWEYEEKLRRERLRGLPRDAVAELARARLTGRTVPDSFSAQLAEATDGHPIFVEQILRQLPPGRLERVELPHDLPQAVRNRFRELDAPTQELLRVGAVQGRAFLSLTVAEVAGVPHEEALERLHRVAAGRRLIRERTERAPQWVRRAGADLYEFEHLALREGVYRGQSTGQRESRHAALAGVLTRIAGQFGAEVPLELRRDIAGQLRAAGPRALAASAVAHHRLALGSALSALSFADAERDCAIAIDAARRLPADGGERDLALVQSVELLLSLTEVRWRGHRDALGAETDIDTLAAEAEAAAHRLGDRRLIARTALQRGKTLMATRGLRRSLEKLAEAVRRAEESDDPVALFVAKVEYGRQLPKRDLAAGLRELAEAERLYATEPSLGARDNPVLAHARNLNEMQLGVNLYDAGRLGEARKRLLQCTARLRSEPLNAELPIALNYLAQLHLALGAEAEAAEVLREALAFEEKRGGDSGWHAYNAALLALLLSRDPAGREQALELAEAAWLETQRTWLANLVPIVRNLYAEVVLDTARGPADLEWAHRLAVDTCAETAEGTGSGMVRSEIAALVLRSRIRLRQGAVTEAAERAGAALALLERHGDLPALRTEEVLYWSARAVLADGADGARERAGALLARAREQVARKADSLEGDRVLREAFLTRVPLNRWITEGEGLS